MMVGPEQQLNVKRHNTEVTFVVYSFWAEYYGGLENNGH
jgi:hypothetical protein